MKKISDKEAERIRNACKGQTAPRTPGTNIVQSMALVMNQNLLKVGITKGCEIYEQNLPQEAVDYVERHTGMFKGVTDSTNITIYPHPTKKDVSYMVITGCKIGQMISHLIYKVTPNSDPKGKDKQTITKCGNVIEATKCSGNFSWH